MKDKRQTLQERMLNADLSKIDWNYNVGKSKNEIRLKDKLEDNRLYGNNKKR